MLMSSDTSHDIVNDLGEKETVSTRHISQTTFFNELMHDIFGPRKGGAIVFIDAENARKGVAKTAAAVMLARFLSNRIFKYPLKSSDFTLSGLKYLQRYHQQPGKEKPSTLVIDEFVGAGAGDARRAMSNENVDLGSAWQMMRKKRVITFATLPDWNEADPRLQKLADYRLWCRERPIGYFQPYKVTTPFSASGSDASVRLEGLPVGDTDRITFPNPDRFDDPYFKMLERKKNEVLASGGWDADSVAGMDEDEEDEGPDPKEVERDRLREVAIRMYEPWNEDSETTYEEIADVIGRRSPDWVGKQVRRWKKGEFRELVPVPAHYQ